MGTKKKSSKSNVLKTALVAIGGAVMFGTIEMKLDRMNAKERMEYERILTWLTDFATAMDEKYPEATNGEVPKVRTT